jgi:uncharacterized protein Yka (UPF0111/DUF47 family)
MQDDKELDPYMELLNEFLECFTLSKRLVEKLDKDGIKMKEIDDLRQELKRLEEMPQL